MQLRFMMPFAIGAALGLWGMGCSSDEAPANVGGSSMQAGAAGQSSTGGGGTSAGTGGQSAAGGSATIDASPDVAAPASDAEISKQEASTSDQRSSATGPFALTSTAFKEGADVPVVYRCTDQNVSPPLSWTPGPAATQSYAVMMVHAAADMSIHWALWDIPASVTTLPMGVDRVPNPTVPAGSKQAKPGIDGSTWSGYTGPCPGSANQKYEYAVYALDIATLPGVTVQSTTADVAAAVTAHQLPSARATLTGGASK